MNKPLEVPHPKPRPPGEREARSIGEVIAEHLDEIVGPDTAERYRREQRKGRTD